MSSDNLRKDTAQRHIKFSVENKIATLTLNRPEVLNAFGLQMLNEIAEALTEVENDEDIKVLVMTGAGSAFSSGADIRSISAESPDLVKDLLEEKINPIVRKIANLSVPVIASVNGVVAGGGLGLALSADITIASQSAYFLLPFAKIGLIPDAGSSWFVQRNIGMARARALALLGERLEAKKAEEWGLIWQCVADAELNQTVDKIAEKLAAGSTQTYVLTRETLVQNYAVSLDQALAVEGSNQKIAGSR